VHISWCYLTPKQNACLGENKLLEFSLFEGEIKHTTLLKLAIDKQGYSVAQVAEALRYNGVGSIPDGFIRIFH
jgi:hypothetical protein